MPDPVPTPTVDVISLFNGLSLPTPCDPATQLFPVIKCVAGVWQLLLVDSEELGGYIGIDVSSRKAVPDKQKQPCKECPPATTE